MTGLALCNPRDSETFRALFNIESYIRLIIRWELKGNFGTSWKGVIPSGLLSEIKSRQEQEINLRCVEANRTNLLSYLNLSELKDLLVIDELWDGSFKRYWGAQDIVLADFKRLIAVRNKMAHFRAVTERDFNLVVRFLEDLGFRTENYDTIRSVYGRVDICNISSQPSKLYEDQFVKSIIELVKSTKDMSDTKVTLSSLSHHWGLEIEVSAGSLDGSEFIKYLDNNHNLLSVCRVGELGDRFDFQFSKKIPEQQRYKLVEDALLLSTNVIEGISSADSIDTYKVNMREDVIPWKLNFPCAYRT